MKPGAELKDVQDSRLLHLPSEIRNRVYELTLIQPEPIRILSGRSEADKRALLRTCHQLHDEAAGMYYANNTFIADCGSSFLNTELISWLRSLGPKKRLLLTDIRVRLDQQQVFWRRCEMDDTLFFMKALVKRLERLGLMLPLDVLRLQFGSEYLKYSELRAYAKDQK